MLDSISNKEKDAQQEAQRQRNLEQALLIQMEMQKKLHEQLEVCYQKRLTMLCESGRLCQALLYTTGMLQSLHGMCTMQKFRTCRSDSSQVYTIHNKLRVTGCIYAATNVLSLLHVVYMLKCL